MDSTIDGITVKVILDIAQQNITRYCIKLENYVWRTQDRLKTNKRKSCITTVVTVEINGRDVLGWRHQMETFSALVAICAGNSPVPGEFPTQRPVTRSFDVFFDLRLNKRLSKQWWSWWFATLSHPLWRHRNAIMIFRPLYLPWCNSCGYFCNVSHCAIRTNSVENFSRRIRYCDACITTIHQVLCNLLCNNLNGQVGDNGFSLLAPDWFQRSTRMALNITNTTEGMTRPISWPVMWAVRVPFVVYWSCYANNRDAGDLRRRDGHVTSL